MAGRVFDQVTGCLNTLADHLPPLATISETERRATLLFHRNLKATSFIISDDSKTFLDEDIWGVVPALAMFYVLCKYSFIWSEFPAGIHSSYSQS